MPIILIYYFYEYMPLMDTINYLLKYVLLDDQLTSQYWFR